MQEYDIQAPDGSVITVMANDPQHAWEVYTKETFNNAPWYAKAGQAADDMMRMAGNSASFGLADRLAALLSGTSWEEQAQKTEDARIRAGFGPSLAAEMAGYGGAGAVLPSSIKAAERIGSKIGGPVSKWLWGSAASGAEGAAMGALENTVNEQDTRQGGIEGALGGVAGNTLATGIRAGIKGGQYLGKKLGILADDAVESLPPKRKGGRISKATKMRNEATTMLDAAVNKAKRKATGGGDESFDSALSTQLSKILDDPKKASMFPPEVLEAIQRAQEGDTSMWLGRKLRKVGQAQYVVGGAGTAVANLLTGGHPMISAGAVGVPAVGLLGRRMANKGAKRLVDEAQRTMRGEPHIVEKDRLAEMLRGLGL